MQSSSGGDEDYDSRSESISSFMINNTNNKYPSSYPPPPAPAPVHQHHHPTSLFEPLSSNYVSNIPLSSSPSSNPNYLLNLDMVWTKSLRSDSEPNCTDLGGLFIPSNSSSFSSSPALQHIPQGGVTESVSASGPNNNKTLMVRNPKKRTRASRRAPTTVLTTDATNFRAMVQEFTGIPAPPFTSFSSFPGTMLDLFGTSSSRSTSYSHHLDSSSLPPPSYYNLLRPFAQKFINPIPFTSSNSMIDANASINSPPPPPAEGSSLQELGLSYAGAHLNTNLMSELQSWTGSGTAAVGSNENHEELWLFANEKLK